MAANGINGVQVVRIPEDGPVTDFPELLSLLPRSAWLSRGPDTRREEYLEKLPNLQEEDLEKLGHTDSACPICFVPLLAVLAEEEMALAMDSPAHPVQDLGVTRLEGTCGHVFCRKDISKWILSSNTSCPMCRTALALPARAAPAGDGPARTAGGMLIPDIPPLPDWLESPQFAGLADMPGMREMMDEYEASLVRRGHDVPYAASRGLPVTDWRDRERRRRELEAERDAESENGRSELAGMYS